MYLNKSSKQIHSKSIANPSKSISIPYMPLPPNKNRTVMMQKSLSFQHFHHLSAFFSGGCPSCFGRSPHWAPRLMAGDSYVRVACAKTLKALGTKAAQQAQGQISDGAPWKWVENWWFSWEIIGKASQNHGKSRANHGEIFPKSWKMISIL